METQDNKIARACREEASGSAALLLLLLAARAAAGPRFGVARAQYWGIYELPHPAVDACRHARPSNEHGVVDKTGRGGQISVVVRAGEGW